MAHLATSELPTGRPLPVSIFNREGTLLLADGQLLTEEIKQRLLAQNVTEVCWEGDGSLYPSENSPAEFDYYGIDPAIIRKLDDMIADGQLFVANSGEAVKSRLVLNGCRAFDPAQRARLLDHHRTSAKALDAAIASALRGKPPKSNELMTVTAMYLTELTADCDHVLASATEIAYEHALVSQLLQTSILAMAMGIESDFDAEQVRLIGLCALLHDWGMQLIPPQIRDANRRLNSSEFVTIKRHPIRTLELLQGIDGMSRLVPLVCYQVHECPNGTGYPRGRKAASIHPLAHLLRVADAYVGMTLPRPHREPLMAYAAMECLIRGARDQIYDPGSVRCLLRVLGLFPIGSYVQLSDGSIGCVLRANHTEISKPIVQRMVDDQGRNVSGETTLIELHSSPLQILRALPSPKRVELKLTAELQAMGRR